MTKQSVILEVIRRHPDGIITSDLARLTGATVINAYDKGTRLEKFGYVRHTVERRDGHPIAVWFPEADRWASRATFTTLRRRASSTIPHSGAPTAVTTRP